MRSTNSARQTMRSAVSLLGVLSALAGCAVGPDFKTPEVKVSDNWSTKDDPRTPAQVEADSRWWKGFNDPVLDQLVELAYKQNLPLQIAGLKVVEARAQLGIATGQQFPQTQELTAGATVLGLTNQQATALGLSRTYLGYQVGFDAAWELDFWGKYRRGVEADSAGLLASVADYYYALVSLTAEVARTYAVIRTFELLVAQANDNVKVQEGGLRIADSRHRNGATSELDVTQATTLLESTRATVPKLQAGEQQSRNALSTLLGQQPGTVDELLTGPKDLPGAPAKVAISVPAEMLRRRPDIRRAELYAAAQCALIGVAKSELYPSFSLFGSIGFQAGTAGSMSHNLFATNALTYGFGPQINWPFFNYGRIENGVRVQDARFQQLLVDYRNTVLKAAQEVEDALAGFVNAQDAVVFEQNSVKAAQRSVEISLVAYQEGSADYQRVLDAQRSLLQEENSLVETRSSVITSLIALYKALGGGWEMSIGHPFVPEQTQKEMRDRTNWGDMLSEPRGPEARQNAAPGKH